LKLSDAPAFMDDAEIEPTYLGQRWRLARSQIRRVLWETAIDDQRFFEGEGSSSSSSWVTVLWAAAERLVPPHATMETLERVGGPNQPVSAPRIEPTR
jgi:hypothetical protein